MRVKAFVVISGLIQMFAQLVLHYEDTIFIWLADTERQTKKIDGLECNYGSLLFLLKDQSNCPDWRSGLILKLTFYEV